MTTNQTVVLPGKPWATHTTCETYDAAAAIKEELTSEKLQVKIRRNANDNFLVKTRDVGTPKGDKAEKKSKSKTRAGRRAEKMKRKNDQIK